MKLFNLWVGKQSDLAGFAMEQKKLPSWGITIVYTCFEA